MARYVMLIDVNKCSGCGNCYLACKDEFCGGDRLPYAVSQPYMEHRWIDIKVKEEGQIPRVYIRCIPVTCMQCQDAPCAAAACDGAVYRRPDGIVLIDPVLAAGQRELVEACPYGAIYWNEERGVPQKCTMCAHRLDQGQKPRCVEACPTRALIFGDLDDPQCLAAELWVTGKPEILYPEYGLEVNVRYLGLPKQFVTGTVCLDGCDEGAENIPVTLDDGRVRKETKTDFFGLFTFTGLEAGRRYELTVAAEGYEPVKLPVVAGQDVRLGNIILKRNNSR